ncbi:PE family protein [Mycobacterium sp. 1081908.1]|uniref:PE family protein n=1 Tax=Mycobacterium sp. 1081908.1 TaxID=1834066 RepID=UPI0007FFCC80|nr:PE family protein [Mycobacterium sp. 1081908.1]OBK46621.1 hypothetical protein A5655_00260 [Mycobacterium sp. 1081908.1]
MSLLRVAPDIVSEASGNLQNLGSALREASAAAASQTTSVVAPAADEVSAAITALLGSHAQEFQDINARATAFHEEFVGGLNGAATQYASTELASAQQTLANFVAAPPQAPPAAAFTPEFSRSFNVGPFEISLSATALSFGTGGALGLANGSLALNTPFGVVPLLSATGTDAFAPNGQFLLSLGQALPHFSYGTSVTGTLLPAISITGVTVGISHLQLSFPGTYFGGLLPNASIQ